MGDTQIILYTVAFSMSQAIFYSPMAQHPKCWAKRAALQRDPAFASLWRSFCTVVFGYKDCIPAVCLWDAGEEVGKADGRWRAGNAS